jgi:hypothetical protein
VNYSIKKKYHNAIAGGKIMNRVARSLVRSCAKAPPCNHTYILQLPLSPATYDCPGYTTQLETHHQAI